MMATADNEYQELDLKLVWGLLRTAIHILVGVLILAIVFRFCSFRQRQALIRWWSRKVLGICGVTVRIVGNKPAFMETISAPSKQGMLLMNHISWIDIYVIHAFKPARFVAKSEIRSWPFIGYLCDRTGTIFIERGKRHAVHDVNKIVAEVLRNDGFVAVFPEGTTTDGTHLLPFHANLIQAAVDAGVPVQPAALRYLKPGRRGESEDQPTRAAAYIDQINLIDSLKMIIHNAPIIAEIRLLDSIPPTGYKRHEIAAMARSAIARELGFNINPDADIARIRPGTAPDLPVAPL